MRHLDDGDYEEYDPYEHRPGPKLSSPYAPARGIVLPGWPVLRAREVPFRERLVAIEMYPGWGRFDYE